MSKKTSRAQPSAPQAAPARPTRPGMFAGESAFFIDTDPHVVELFEAQGGVVADRTGFDSSTYVICDNPDHELCSKAWNTNRLARAIHKSSFIISAIETGEKSTTTEHVLQPRIVRPKPYAFFPRQTPAPITFADIRHPTPAPIRVAQNLPRQEAPQPVEVPPPQPRPPAASTQAPSSGSRNGHDGTSGSVDHSKGGQAVSTNAPQQRPVRKKQQVQSMYTHPEHTEPPAATAESDNLSTFVEQPTFGTGQAPHPPAEQQPPQPAQQEEPQAYLEPPVPEEDHVPRSPTKIAAMFRAGNIAAQQKQHAERARPAQRQPAPQSRVPQENLNSEPKFPVPAPQQPRAAPRQLYRPPMASPYVKESFGDVTRRKLEQLRKSQTPVAPEIHVEERPQERFQPTSASVGQDDDDDISEAVEVVPVPQRKRKRDSEYLAHPTAIWWDDIENLPDVSLFHDIRWALDTKRVRHGTAPSQKPAPKRTQKS